MPEEACCTILSRQIYCFDAPCKQGGYINFNEAGIPAGLDDNYGLPCVGGWITYDDGEEIHSPRCIFCGGLP